MTIVSTPKARPLNRIFNSSQGPVHRLSLHVVCLRLGRRVGRRFAHLGVVRSNSSGSHPELSHFCAQTAHGHCRRIADTRRASEGPEAANPRRWTRRKTRAAVQYTSGDNICPASTECPGNRCRQRRKRTGDGLQTIRPARAPQRRPSCSGDIPRSRARAVGSSERAGNHLGTFKLRMVGVAQLDRAHWRLRWRRDVR